MTYDLRLNALLRVLVTDEYFGNGGPSYGRKLVRA